MRNAINSFFTLSILFYLILAVYDQKYLESFALGNSKEKPVRLSR